MKELSNEELVMGIENIVNVSTKRKSELLSRLSRLDEVEKENKELKEEIRHWEGSRDGVLQSITEQEHKYLLVCKNYITLQKQNDQLRSQLDNLQKRLDVACHIKSEERK